MTAGRKRSPRDGGLLSPRAEAFPPRRSPNILHQPVQEGSALIEASVAEATDVPSMQHHAPAELLPFKRPWRVICLADTELCAKRLRDELWVTSNGNTMSVASVRALGRLPDEVADPPLSRCLLAIRRASFTAAEELHRRRHHRPFVKDVADSSTGAPSLRSRPVIA